jgi:hypothetical protein
VIRNATKSRKTRTAFTRQNDQSRYCKNLRNFFSKIQQLIKKYKLNQNELRKIDKFIVYEHWLEREVLYVGSGVWHRCRRYKNRRNTQHRMMMEEGKIQYKIVAEFDDKDEARKYEATIIKRYKEIGQAKFNIKRF